MKHTSDQVPKSLIHQKYSSFAPFSSRGIMSSTTPAKVIRPKTCILDKNLSRGKQEVSLSAFALLFSEMVQYAQSR